MLALNIVNSFYLTTSKGPRHQAKAVVFFILVAVIGIAQLVSTRKEGGASSNEKYLRLPGRAPFAYRPDGRCLRSLPSRISAHLRSCWSTLSRPTPLLTLIRLPFPQANTFMGLQNYIKGMTFGNYPVL